jgi:hypothetical protein
LNENFLDFFDFAVKKICGLRIMADSARGIVAESPQDLHGQIRGLGAESPVFLPGRGQKNAPEDSRFPVVFR